MLRVRDKETGDTWWLDPIQCDKGLAFNRKVNPDDKNGIELHFLTIEDFQMQYEDYKEMPSIEKSFIKAIKYFFGLEDDCLIKKEGDYLILVGKDNPETVYYDNGIGTKCFWVGGHFNSLKQGELYQIRELMESENE